MDIIAEATISRPPRIVFEDGISLNSRKDHNIVSMGLIKSIMLKVEDLTYLIE